MKVCPPCEITSLVAAKGHLVRPLRYGSGAEFAVAAGVEDNEDSAALILFGDAGPSCRVVSVPDQVRVLSYGQGWFVEVDLNGPFEAYSRSMYEANGILIREQERWLLNVWEDGFRHQRGQLDLSKTVLVQVSSEINNIAAFGKWTLYLGEASAPRERWTDIASFGWQPPGGQDG